MVEASFAGGDEGAAFGKRRCGSEAWAHRDGVYIDDSRICGYISRGQSAKVVELFGVVECCQSTRVRQ